jgi:hypothetical protein
MKGLNKGHNMQKWWSAKHFQGANAFDSLIQNTIDDNWKQTFTIVSQIAQVLREGMGLVMPYFVDYNLK